ncbi:ATP synthase F0 subcomplex B subunit [Tangfeifania diversioriginum]|uniref:ATP synthase subunit b n=1 Tax=Tangfeifania diversioriginum TaxID=1168035 RepID=A0A1M6ILB9_9BACT|nr:F0F1 ATP synthase subunit B [Tangfeifania diversioriginum]SHJ35251.1 ATP synthase F0 subcomplex B subunit [Tangfeifania diversioriginum]
MELVTPNLGTIFWMVIIISIVAFVLKKFAWKPILNALYEREESIETALNAAQEARQEMDKLKAGNEELLAEARKEKESILREAMNLKESVIAEAKEKASAETQRSIEHARQQIQNERAKAVNEMKKQMAQLSLMIAEKVIRKEMADDKNQQEMVKRIVDEIELN